MNRWLHLSADQVAQIDVPISEIRTAIEGMFREKAAGGVDLPPKLGVSLGEEGFLHAMPCSIPRVGAVGMKWIGSFPENATRGMPQVSGVIVLNDPESGLPAAVLDAGWVTAKRTAAASVVAAQWIAHRPVHTLTILGCGTQGRSHLEAFISAFPVQQVIVYDILEEAARAFVEEAALCYSGRVDPAISFVVARSPEEAACAGDVVITAGSIAKKSDGTIRSGWLRQGACGISIDFASTWSAEAISEFKMVVVDDRQQFRAYQQMGYCTHVSRVDASMEEIIGSAGDERGREQSGGFACMLGLASEDVVVADLVLQRARALGVGTWIDR